MLTNPHVTADLVRERQAELIRHAPTRRHRRESGDFLAGSGMRGLAQRVAHRLAVLARFHRHEPETATARLADEPC